MASTSATARPASARAPRMASAPARRSVMRRSFAKGSAWIPTTAACRWRGTLVRRLTREGSCGSRLRAAASRDHALRAEPRELVRAEIEGLAQHLVRVLAEARGAAHGALGDLRQL